MKNIKAVMDKNFSSIKIDQALIKRIKGFVDAFRTKNEDHIHFFGSNHFAVHKVVFTTIDRMEWLNDVLDIDETEIRDDLINLPTIQKDWKKYTDVVNMSCVYLIHRIFNSSLSNSVKQEGMVACALVLNIKAFTSFINAVLPYQTDEKTAEQIYNNLSYKYSLKKAGTWMGVLTQRSEDMVSPKSIHFQVIKTFDPDAKVLYFISDTITRMKDLVKNLYDELTAVKGEDIKSLRSSMMVEMEEGITVRDVVGQYDKYKNYIEQVLNDKSSFIKAEIAHVVIGMMNDTLPPPILNSAIIAFYEQYGRKNKIAYEILDLVLEHAFDQIHKDKEIQKKAGNIAELLVFMHSRYTSPKSKGDIEKMRNIGDKFVKKYVKSNNSTVIAAARTGLLLYILARTFLKDKY